MNHEGRLTSYESSHGSLLEHKDIEKCRITTVHVILRNCVSRPRSLSPLLCHAGDVDAEPEHPAEPEAQWNEAETSRAEEATRQRTRKLYSHELVPNANFTSSIMPP